MLKLQKALFKQLKTIEKTIEKRENIYSKRCEKWQMSDNGAIYESDTNDLDTIKDNIKSSIELLEQITYVKL